VKEQPGPVSSDGATPYRRRYVRVAVDSPVSYVREGSEQAKQGHSSDLGGGGIRLATAEDLPLGSVLTLRFKIPGGDQEVVARGRIVLSFFNADDKQFFHGIAFTQIDPRDQDAIIRYVADEVQRLALEGEAAAD
jgi:c-di-GMP-binding flagellar brake protein YcgR